MSRFVQKVILVMLAVVLGVSLGACQQELQVVEAPAPPDHAAELGPALDAFIGVWNSQDYVQLDAILAENFERTAPDQSVEGREAMKAFMGQVHTAYADFNITVEATAYAEDLAFLQWTVTGTYAPEGGEGINVHTPGITMLRFADGLISHEVARYDTAAMMKQLGATEVPHVE